MLRHSINIRLNEELSFVFKEKNQKKNDFFSYFYQLGAVRDESVFRILFDKRRFAVNRVIL